MGLLAALFYTRWLGGAPKELSLLLPEDSTRNVVSLNLRIQVLLRIV